MINTQETSQITKIYLVTNCYGDPNKVYIGKTKNSREQPHRQKYGKDIIYTEMDEVNSLYHEDWEPLETFWIEYFVYLGFNVLNIRKKGGSGPISHSLESREKMSKSHFGKILSQEIRNKISKNKIDRKTIEITQYDLNNNFIKNWNSAKDVAIYFNKINGGDITKCCKKKLPIAYGYIWRYKNDPLDYNYELPKRQRGKYIVKDFL